MDITLHSRHSRDSISPLPLQVSQSNVSSEGDVDSRVEEQLRG